MKIQPAVVVLAAGAGSRYLGPRHKLAEGLDGSTVLARTVRNALDSQLPVVVVLSPVLRADIAGMLPEADIVILDTTAPLARGMGVSIAAGVAASSGAGGWLMLPGDMPLVRPQSLRAVAAALDQQPVAFAQYHGRRGHPVGFAAELFSELVKLRGDDGARRLLARYPTAAVELDDPGVLMDIDTAEDLAAMRRRFAEAPGVDSA